MRNVLKRIGSEDNIKCVVFKWDVFTVKFSYRPYAIRPIIA